MRGVTALEPTIAESELFQLTRLMRGVTASSSDKPA